MFTETLLSVLLLQLPETVMMAYSMSGILVNEILLKELVQTYRQNLPSPATSNLGVGSRLPIFDNIRSRWQCFIGSYSRNQLTKDSDIFVALQGIAQDVIVDTLEDRLLAVLSESHFAEELCWRVLDYSKPNRELEHWRAPSWSWASTIYPVAFPQYRTNFRQTLHDLLRVVTCNVPTKSSGVLIDAFLSMECKLLPGEI
jgi:hypothetical protein